MTLILNGTDGLSDVDGTAATPAIRGTDTNTGIFFPAADTIAFSEGGTEVMRIDSAGNVGIGASSPAFKLDVNGDIRTNAAMRVGTTSGDTLDIFHVTSGGYISQAGARFLGFGTNNAERMRIDSSGNVLINTSTPVVTDSGTTDGFTYYGSSSAFPNRMDLSRNDAQCLNLRRRSSDGVIVTFSRDTTNVGSINVTTSATSYVTSSDYRLKENIAPMTGALAKVALLKPVTYQWKVDGSDGQGFIAHELQSVVPDCVTGEKDAVNKDGSIKPQGIDTSFLVATLTAAIQELKATVDAQAARIAALESVGSA